MFADVFLDMIRNILILGGGSAGFLAALTLKRSLPRLDVRVVRSPEIGVIGVGEGTTQYFPRFLFQQLRLKPAQFYAEAQPTWKLGLRFLEWGPRPHFFYSFSARVDNRWPELPKNHGYYAEFDFDHMDLWSSLMAHDRALPRDVQGRPAFCNHDHLAFHIENQKLVAYLEARCRDFGVEILDGTVNEVEKGERGVEALRLESGLRLTADLFVDASGFRSELLGRALEVEFQSYADALFCDRAIIGGWLRTTEPIKPYTTCETMDAGWCWQIEHEHWINRGYVYSSRFTSDDAAVAELLRKNPQIANEPRLVKFRSGRYAQMWSGNVIGIGNASGFVEPLEATALQCIMLQCRTLTDLLVDSDGEPTPTGIALYNRFIGQVWDDVRDFLAVHYRFNTRLDTPFWQAARAETALHDAAPLVEFYRENGPSALGKSILLNANNAFGLEGYLAMLVGQQVPYEKMHPPSAEERRAWQMHQQEFLLAAKRGFDVRQVLEIIRRPGWQWA